MAAIALAFLASVGWGCSDFLGGLRTRSLPLRATVTCSVTGGVIVGGASAVLLGGWPGTGFILPGVLGGCASLVAFLSLYKALAIGSMSIVAPISAAYPVVPVIYGLAQGERPATVQLAGMALIVAGVIVASYAPAPVAGEPVIVAAPDIAGGAAAPAPSGDRGHTVSIPSLALAAVSALASGTALTGMSSAAETDPYWGLLVLRGTAFAIMVLYLVASRRGLGAPAARIPGLLLIGALDATATGLFAVASTYGYLSVVSVIASLFPLGTIALARLTLGERILPHQNAGVAVALTGVALVALA